MIETAIASYGLPVSRVQSQSGKQIFYFLRFNFNDEFDEAIFENLIEYVAGGKYQYFGKDIVLFLFYLNQRFLILVVDQNLQVVVVNLLI